MNGRTIFLFKRFNFLLHLPLHFEKNNKFCLLQREKYKFFFFCNNEENIFFLKYKYMVLTRYSKKHTINLKKNDTVNLN